MATEAGHTGTADNTRLRGGRMGRCLRSIVVMRATCGTTSATMQRAAIPKKSAHAIKLLSKN